MSDVTTRWDLVREYGVRLVIVASVPVAVWFALGLGRLGLFAAVGLIGLVVGTYIGLRHPLWLYWALAFTLAALPFGYFPGVHVPMYLALAFGVLLAALIHPSQRTGLSRLEKAVVALVVISGLTLVFGGITLPGMVEYGKWAMAMLMMVALMRLSPANMAKFGRIYVYTAAANAIYGIFVVVADPQQKSYRLLSIFGYGAGSDGSALRYAFVNDQGVVASLRLGGTWVEPNSAGLSMLFALGIGVVVLSGWRRVAVSAIFLAAIPLTLSRAALATIVFGFVLVLLFHTMRSRDRILGLAALVLVPLAALAVPTVRSRIFSTLSSTDPGANDRARSLREFPTTMSGHWTTGLGWGRPEFKDGNLAFQLNYVSNAPLITVYRAGIFAGLAFVAILVIGCIIGYRALRSSSTPNAILGGLFISAAVLALQLDHTVASVPQPTMLFGILLAFLASTAQSSSSPPDRDALLPHPPRRAKPTTRESRPAAAPPPPDAVAAPASAGR
jgi:hypothetical protein